MKKIFLTLVIVFAFGMNANAQNYAVVDNAAIVKKMDAIEKSLSNENLLDKSNKTNFSKNYSKKAKKLSKAFVNGKMVALKRGYIYKNKFHWLIMTIDSSTKYNVYVFTSNTDFTSLNHKEVNKDINLRDYILENY
jgi:hypothetical protein